MDPGKSLRNRHRSLGKRRRTARIRILSIQELSPQEFLKRRAAGTPMMLLDVREDWETQLAPVPTDLKHIPMGQVADRLSELDPQQDTVVICRSGVEAWKWRDF